MQGSRPGGGVRLSPIPIYLADTLAVTEVAGPNLETLVEPVDRDRNEAFYIPADVARSPVAFTSLIEQMEEYARYSPDDLSQNAAAGFLRLVRERSGAAQSGIADLSQTYWAANLRLLNRLIAEGRNSIWGYLLKNTARPLLLAAQRRCKCSEGKALSCRIPGRDEPPHRNRDRRADDDQRPALPKPCPLPV